MVAKVSTSRRTDRRSLPGAPPLPRCPCARPNPHSGDAEPPSRPPRSSRRRRRLPGNQSLNGALSDQQAGPDASEGASGSPGPTDTRVPTHQGQPDLSADGSHSMPQVSSLRVREVGGNSYEDRPDSIGGQIGSTRPNQTETVSGEWAMVCTAHNLLSSPWLGPFEAGERTSCRLQAQPRLLAQAPSITASQKCLVQGVALVQQHGQR